jgi:protein-tyrosine phosphatase
MAEWLLKRQAVHVIASDAHDALHRRPILSQARKIVAKLAGAEVAEALFVQTPSAIVEGKDLPGRTARDELGA